MSSDNQEELPRMSWMAHFVALRKALTVCALCLSATTLCSFWFIHPLWNFLMIPMPNGVSHTLHNLRPSDPLVADFKVCLWSGVVLASPVLFWQIWKFLAPALYRIQRRTVIQTVFFSVFFFVMGSAFAFQVVIPLCLGFFYGYAKGIADPTWTQESYLDFVINFLLTFGLVFQIPVASQLLARFGLLSSSFLISQWRFAVLIIFVSAALLSPPDVFSQFLLAIPMLALYGLSIIWVKQIEKRTKIPEQS